MGEATLCFSVFTTERVLVKNTIKRVSVNALGTVNDFTVGYTDTIDTACQFNNKLKYVFLKINTDAKCREKTSTEERNAFTVLMSSSVTNTKCPLKISEDGARFTRKSEILCICK